MKRVVFDFTDEEAAKYEKSHGSLEKFLQTAIDNEREAIKVEVSSDANEDDKPEQKLKAKQSK